MDTILSWVDESPEQMAAVRRFLNALDNGAIDYLGFLRIYNRFANLLFPGTSTIMTRARYFIFLPAIYKEIEEMGLSEKEAEKKAREFQYLLRDLLYETDPNETGIIGRNAGMKVKSLPIDIYGSALSFLRIRVDGHAGYGAAFFSKMRNEQQLRDEKERGRNKDELESFASVWDPQFRFTFHFENLKKGRDKLHFELRKDEAKYLQHKFIHYDEDYHPSLMGFLINYQPDKELPINLDWALLYEWRKKMPPETCVNVENAYKIQRLAQVIEQLYLVYLVRLKYPDRVELISRTEEYLAELMEERLLRDFVNTFQDWLPAATLDEAKFFQKLCDKFKTHKLNPGLILADKEIEDTIRNREVIKKGARARTASQKALDAWSVEEAPMAGELNFRFTIGTRLVREIRAGLNAK